MAEEAALRQAAASDRVRQQTAQMAVQATLRRVLRDYHAKHVEPVLTAKHSSQWINSVERHIPTKLLDKPIAMIEASELLDALQPLYIQVPGRTVRRVRQRLDTVFDHAVLRKLAPGNPAKMIVRALRQKHGEGQFSGVAVRRGVGASCTAVRTSGYVCACARVCDFNRRTHIRSVEYGVVRAIPRR